MTARLAAKFSAAALVRDRERGAGLIEYVIVVILALGIAALVFPPLRSFVSNLLSNLTLPSFG